MPAEPMWEFRFILRLDPATMALVYTPIDEIEKVNTLFSFVNRPNVFQIHADLRGGFRSGKLKSIAYRKYQLLQLGYLVKDNIQRFRDALAADLGRPEQESDL